MSSKHASIYYVITTCIHTMSLRNTSILCYYKCIHTMSLRNTSILCYYKCIHTVSSQNWVDICFNDGSSIGAPIMFHRLVRGIVGLSGWLKRRTYWQFNDTSPRGGSAILIDTSQNHGQKRLIHNMSYDRRK